VTELSVPSLNFPKPGRWQQSTVIELRNETSRAKTVRLKLSEPTPHLAGQHYVVRLTAPDGYTASRSYSVASAPDHSGEIELTVEWLADGEVSSFIHEELAVGDLLEVRGPIGGWFVWHGDTPALLVGGGSGIVPVMAMLRLARRSGRPDLARLIVSVRSPDDLYYARELAGPEVTVVYTRRTPPAWPRPPGHLVADDVAPLVHGDATAYVCGSSGFADSAAGLITAAGMASARIRVERFGPTR
jgi:ferredoxin-NADP reductase